MTDHGSDSLRPDDSGWPLPCWYAVGLRHVEQGGIRQARLPDGRRVTGVKLSDCYPAKLDHGSRRNQRKRRIARTKKAALRGRLS